MAWTRARCAWKARKVGEAVSDRRLARRAYRVWSEEEDRVCAELSLAGFNSAEIAALLNRSPPSVGQRRSHLSVTSGGMPQWSTAEDDLLRDLRTLVSYSILASLLGRTPDAVRVRVRRLGLALARTNACGRWSHAEVAVLRESYSHLSTQHLMLLLPGRTESAILSRAKDEALTKSADYLRWQRSTAGRKLPAPLGEIVRLSRNLRKAVANEERRRSQGDALRRPGSSKH